MRIVFIGTVLFSRVTLEKLIEIGANVVGVITKEKNEFNSDFEDLTPICLREGIPFKYVNDINHPNNIAYIKHLEPHVIYCFGWSSLIKTDLLNTAPLGVIGFHPAALPYNRGRHPLTWALVLGLKKTASTFFIMDEGADTGDIVSQQFIDISDTDDAMLLYNKIIEAALVQIPTFTQALQEGNLITVKQPVEGNTWRKRGIADGKIDFRMNSKTIYNLVRALTKPYVGAHIDYKGEQIKIWKANPILWSEVNIEPGKVLEVTGNIIRVKTSNGAIELVEHGFEILPNTGDYL
ncbi:formyl transferase [Adhaeribacter swui]|uniref:Formyl transferase n=1 Tax=Adhaeribacter swui TaxID=2086471 RepID=A0A7G7G9H4_9BACT|nr:formyltransferase family protein [Adhaeribacter swui]QNF33808.1 formyl transferase [Adhaeribacter swui]